MTRFLYALLLVLTPGVSAQGAVPPVQTPLAAEARAVLDEARAITAEALASYESYHPDQPLFREAIRLSRRAVNLAPENPETLRFLAEVYGVTGFYGPAFGIWQRYARAGGLLDGAARAELASSGTQVGYARYTQGDLTGALAAYRTVTRLEPGSVRAQRWSGRILLEQNNPRAALPFWRRVAALRPGDAGAAYFVTLSGAGVRHGLAAAQAFYGGVADYEAGRTRQARAKFTRATDLAPTYAEAWGYRGRLAFEAGRFAAAATAYERAGGLAPQNETYRYFLQEARQQARARQAPTN